jgi:protein-S-isoprenylcysteine O-methyltransferase Ste14
MKRHDITPMIMWVCLLAGILTLSFFRLKRTTGIWNEYAVNFDIVFIGLYIIWMLAELNISKNDIHTEGKETSDFATCQIYGFGQALVFLTALWFSSIWETPNIAHAAGICFFLAGIGYRLWAIHTLGMFYSHRVRIIEQHQVMVSGPYRFTRHPAYAGMIIANAGVAIYFFNPKTICVFLFIFLPAVILRIIIEEKTLMKIDGYPEFAKKRKRLIPLIW